MNRLGATYFWKMFRKNETNEKFSKNFEKNSKKKSKNVSNDVMYVICVNFENYVIYVYANLLKLDSDFSKIRPP